MRDWIGLQKYIRCPAPYIQYMPVCHHSPTTTQQLAADPDPMHTCSSGSQRNNTPQKRTRQITTTCGLKEDKTTWSAMERQRGRWMIWFTIMRAPPFGMACILAGLSAVCIFACHCCMQVLHTINSSPCMHVLTASVQWWLLTGNDAWVVE